MQTQCLHLRHKQLLSEIGAPGRSQAASSVCVLVHVNMHFHQLREHSFSAGVTESGRRCATCNPCPNVFASAPCRRCMRSLPQRLAAQKLVQCAAGKSAIRTPAAGAQPIPPASPKFDSRTLQAIAGTEAVSEEALLRAGRQHSQRDAEGGTAQYAALAQEELGSATRLSDPDTVTPGRFGPAATKSHLLQGMRGA